MEKSEESGKVLAEEIFALAEAPERLTRAVRIHVNAACHGLRDLEALRAVLSAPEHRGQVPGYLHVLVPEKGEAVIRLAPGYSLRATAGLRPAVRGLFGSDGAVTFQ